MGKLYLYMDCETTGLLKYGNDVPDDEQPYIAALAATLASPDEGVIDELDVLIKPDGWIMEHDAGAVNGLSMTVLEAAGIHITEALERFNALKAQATARVGFGIHFDKRMLAIEATRHDIRHDSSGLETIDLMHVCKPICALPPTAKMKGGFKPPKLTEAYEIIMGRPLDRAHSALADTRACMEIHFKLMEQGLV